MNKSVLDTNEDEINEVGISTEHAMKIARETDEVTEQKTPKTYA